ncbi:MAG: M14 family zinc carboxypeptidase [Stygiobacter sp.]
MKIKKYFLVRYISIFSLFTSLVVLAGAGEIKTFKDILAPIERSHYKRVSSHQELINFISEVKVFAPWMTVESIGKTVQGRDIPILRISKSLNPTDSKKLRVLIFSSQHGNEPSGKEALLLLLKSIVTSERAAWLENLELLIIPSVNPDGNESGRRQNANDADLNRSHLVLDQPESRALHRVFYQCLPEVTLDVHEFGAFNREWVSRGFVRAMDEQFGIPTNLNVSPAIIDYASKELIPFLKNSLSQQNIRFFDYVIVDSPNDTVRHSTTSINDGRQSMAILNTFAFILEGRNGKEFNDDLERRTKGQYAAIEAFLQFASDRADEIRSLVQRERTKLLASRDSVILQMDYLYRGEKISIPVNKLSSGKDSIVNLDYSSRPTPLLSVSRPQGYIIPGHELALIEFLDRHGVQYHRLQKEETYTVEAYVIRSIEKRRMEEKNTYIARVSSSKVNRLFSSGDVIVPLQQLHSTMLVIALEPESMWGLIQYDEFAHLRKIENKYPIYRILLQ